MKPDAKKEQFDRFSADLPEDVRKAIWDLLECQHFDQELWPEDGQLRIEIDSGTACIRYLILHDVSGVPLEADQINFESLIKRKDEYRLVGESEDYSNGETKLFTIRFTHAEVDTQVCRVECPWQDGKPWEMLVLTAIQLMVKYSIAPTLFNSREQAMLPLIVELSRLSHYSDPEEETGDPGYPQLRKVFEEYGSTELLPILEKLEQNGTFPKKDRYLRMLFAKLDTVRYEPLFRKLWDQLSASQEDYLTQAQVRLEEEQLTELRSRIHSLMKIHGYSGTYPDYYKKASIKGLRLAESYNMDYFVMGEKNGVAHIHIREVVTDQVCLELICGTQLLKKNQEKGDYLSCMFNTKGRTFSKAIFCEENQLGVLLPIADKLAQLQPLSKEERKLRTVQKGSSLWLFFLWLIFGGGGFALLFTPAMMLFTALMCLLEGDPVILSDVPWFQLFIFAWLGFGGLTGLTMSLINKLK